MIALGIDTSTTAGSVALAGETGLVAEINVRGVAAHSQRLLGAVRGLLDAAGIGVDRIDRLAVASGPGAFTGLRVGMATAKGLALATGRPLFGYSTLETMALACASARSPGEFVACVLLDAGRGEVYRGMYRVAGGRATPLAREAALAPEAALEGLPAGSLVCGEGVRAYRSRLAPLLATATTVSDETPFIGAALARRALGEAAVKGAGHAPRLVPNYLRPADATIGPQA